MNTDIRISVSFKGHRKRKKLRRILGDKSDSYLIDLWITVSTDCPKGILIGWNEEDIADACCWDGEPKEIADAFVKTGWLDKDDKGQYSVHDWDKHQAWACNADKRSEAARIAARKRWDDIASSKQGESEKDKGGMRGACDQHKDGNAPIPSSPIPSKPSKKENIPPALKEVSDYCLERKNNINPQNFIDHYEANGWMRGKNKIKSWKACIRTWEGNGFNKKETIIPESEIIEYEYDENGRPIF